MGIRIYTSQSAQEALVSTMQALCVRITQTQNESLPVAVFLSGGSVIAGYRKLAEYIEKTEDASRITLLLADERWDADPNHADSNAQQIEEQTHLFLRAKRVGGRVLLPLQGNALEQDARIYNDIVEEIFKTHICIGIFGVGQDCHTAGILPLFSQNEFAVIFEQFPWYAPLVYPFGEHTKRLTLTSQAIARMRGGIVYAVGENKKEALANMLRKSAEEWPHYPAILLRQIPKLHIFTDQSIKNPD
jgi:6-phosphogluconolactonase/glucosamine-6-phosphate isomerase/deaminase